MNPFIVERHFCSLSHTFCTRMHLPGPKLDDATKSDIQQKLVNLVVKLVFHHFVGNSPQPVAKEFQLRSGKRL